MSGERVPALAIVLRTIAVAIAVAGVIDPMVTRARTSTPQIALLGGSAPEDSLTAARVRERLRADGMQVSDALSPHDAARIVVGPTLPALDARRVPTFAYVPAPVAVTRVAVPSRVRLTSQVPVSVWLTARRAATVTLELLDGSVVVAQDQVALAPDSTASRALRWAPSSIGTHALTVRVSTSGTDTPTRVTRAVLVDSARWRVLAYDARPSWNATFIRRALERDGRFDVRSRVVAVRAPQATVARATARTPSSLSALDARSVDVIVVGAPESLPANELAALRRLVANDGVPLVLLPDDATPALAAWVGAGAWRAAPRRESVALRAPATAAADSVATLRALVVAAPTAIAAGSDTLLTLGREPVVWRQPLGVGDVVVSGALDAWRFRDPDQSAFDQFWRTVVAAQAVRRAPTIDVWPDAISIRPGERPALTISAPAMPTVRWVPDSGTSIALPVAPTPQSSTWRALTPFLADPQQGALHVVTASDSALVPIAVRMDASPATMPEPTIRTAWANAAGGQVVSTIDSLIAAVRRAAQPQPEPLPWHPMRSPWWMLPFALALGGDWWLRRRAGQR